jgi:hypothetical protein
MPTARALLARLLPLTLLASLLVLSGSAPASADPIPPTNWSPVSLSDLPAAQRVVTDPSGGATVGCPSGNQAKPFRSFSSAGDTTQDPPTEEPIGVFCNGTSAVGKDGTVYVEASASNGSARYIQAWRANNLAWQYTIPCGRNGSSWTMAMGANGNLYFTVFQGGGACSSTQLIGLSPTGQVVLNIPLQVPGIYGQAMAAYSGGLVMYARDGNIQYVTYTGTVTTVPAGTVTGSYVGAGEHWFDATISGRVFVPNQASYAQSLGCSAPGNNTQSITAIGPEGRAWTTSQLGECTYVHEIHPTPAGGLVMRYTHTNTVGGPQTERLAAFGPTGAILWARDIPAVGPSSSRAAMVDMNGNVAIQTNAAEWQNVNGSTYRFPSVSFTLISGATGQDMPGAQFTLRGDSTTTSGPSYMWGNGSPAITNGTAYVVAYQCTTLDHCDASTTKLYAFKVAGLAMDYPRGAILGNKPTRVYAALGDSFSSGEGAPPFEAGTDVPYSGNLADYDICHRSNGAYARLLAGDESLRLSIRDKGFRACSGAITTQLTTNWPATKLDGTPGPNTKEDRQILALNDSVNVVTISIGGNDAGFKDFVARCMLADCSSAATRQEFLGKKGKVTTLNTKLTDAYTEILKDAPNAKVYVVGYPQLLPTANCSGPGMAALNVSLKALVALAGPVTLALATRAKNLQTMLAAQDIHLTLAEVMKLIMNPSIGFTRNEQSIARDLVVNLDLKIQAMVQQVDAGRGRLIYVDPLKSGSPFNGHALCTATSYFNGLVVNPTNAAYDLSYSFHPNALGQSAYARLVRPYLVPTS